MPRLGCQCARECQRFFEDYRSGERLGEPGGGQTPSAGRRTGARCRAEGLARVSQRHPEEEPELHEIRGDRDLATESIAYIINARTEAAQ